MIKGLREDLEKMIAVAENRKINRTVLQTQFLKSGLFKKVIEVNLEHLAYIKQLENKIERYGKIIVEIDWLRKKELTDLSYRESEGTNHDIIIND